MRSLVGHGCHVGRGCVVAPGAVINARVQLGDGVYVGTNASIMPDLKVGPWATIGANSAVVQDVPAGATVMGVPAQILMQGDIDFSGQFPAGSVCVQTHPDRTGKIDVPASGLSEIPSEAVRKLRAAQQKFMATHQPNKP